MNGIKSVALALALLIMAGLTAGKVIELNNSFLKKSANFVSKIKFKNITAEAGIHFIHKPFAVDPRLKNVTEWVNARGASVTVADFNNDGFMDFYVTSSAEGSKNALYMNLGNGTFIDVAEKMGVADLNHGNNSMSSLWIDYDNDGWPDLYVVAMGCNRLFKNIRGKKFVDVTKQAGDIGGIPDQNGMCGSPASAQAFDYNRDGLLDIFVDNLFIKDRRKIMDGDTRLLQPIPTKALNGPKSYLFRNNGDGTFTEVAEPMGVANRGWAAAAGAADVNNDGWPDLFIANDVGPDKLFINHEGKYFEEVTESALPNQHGRVGMSAEMVDIDGDGLPEIYSTKISRYGYMTGRNELWKNINGKNFKNIAGSQGVSSCGWAWNAKFLDIAHRGLMDLVVVNGMYSGDPKRSYWFAFNSMRSADNYIATDGALWPPMNGADFSGHEKNCVFLNTGNGFIDEADAVGVNDTYDGRGLAAIDIRNNGKQSLIINNASGPVLLYENISDTDENDWIGFDLHTGIHGRTAVGAKVHVVSENSTGIKHQYLEVNAGNGYASQSDPRLVFGLGKYPASIKEVTVSWISGKKEGITNLRKNAYNKIYEK